MVKMRTPDAVDQLSFTRMRPRSEWEGTQLLPRCWWSVTPTDDCLVDSKTGTDLGLEYLAYEAADIGGPGHLGLIVSDMPRELGAIEIAFLTMVSYAAGAGRHRAARVAAYWDECAKREAANG